MKPQKLVMSGKSSRILVSAAAVLVAAMLWFGMRDASHARSPIASPEPERESSTPSATELDRPDTVQIDSIQARAETAETIAAQMPASQRTNASGTIVLYGSLVSPVAADADDESYVRVTDRFGASLVARASSEGAYSISGLAPGHHWLDAGNGTNAGAHTEIDLLLADSPKRFDILLVEAPAVLVKAVDLDGKPDMTPGMLPDATTSEPGEWFDERQDRCLNLGGLGGFRGGRYTGAPLPEGFLGRILLEVPPPVLVSLLYSQRVLATRRVERGQTQVVFPIDADVVKPSTVRVRFVDERGTPAVMAMVDLDGDSSNSMVGDGDSWVARNVMPGNYELRPRGKGLEMRTVPVVVPLETDLDLGTLVLGPDQSVSGKVHVPDDENLSGISILCDACDAQGGTHGTSRTIHGYALQPDGTFSIGNLSSGTYLLQVNEHYPKYGKWARIIDTSAGSVANVDIHLVRGVALGLRPAKKDDAQIRFRIRNSDRTPVVSSRLYSDVPRPILLAPGEYDVEVVEPERARKHVTIGSEPVDLAVP
jgi:hypothetical protein